MTTILFELGHPKHYLQFRHPARLLARDFDVRFAARDKDVLFDLLRADGQAFVPFAPNRGGLRRKLLGAPRVLSEYARLLRRTKPAVVVSRSSPYAAVLGRAMGTQSMVFPDSEGVPLNERIVVPLSRLVVTSESFERSYGAKHHRVPGIFEAGYLHPGYFSPDPAVLAEIGVEPGEPYAVLRFVAWSANHDVGKSGIRPEEKLRLISEIGRKMRVFVSAEGPLAPELAPHRLRLAPARMHDALAFAALYVGDSQTMASEAALLGTPAVRCNSFVGKDDFSNFRNLETVHNLLFNHARFPQALERAVALAADPGAKREWIARRDEYFDAVGDVNRITAELIARAARRQL